MFDVNEFFLLVLHNQQNVPTWRETVSNGTISFNFFFLECQLISKEITSANIKQSTLLPGESKRQYPLLRLHQLQHNCYSFLQYYTNTVARLPDGCGAPMLLLTSKIWR